MIKEMIQFEPASSKPVITNKLEFMFTGGALKETLKTLTITSNVKTNI